MGALVCHSREPSDQHQTLASSEPAELWAKPPAASSSRSQTSSRVPWYRNRRPRSSTAASVVSPTGDSCPCCCAGAAAKLQPELSTEKPESPTCGSSKLQFSKTAWESQNCFTSSSPEEYTHVKESPYEDEQATELLADPEDQCNLCNLFTSDGILAREDSIKGRDDRWSNLDEEVTFMVDTVSSLSSIVEERLKVKNKTREDVWKGTFGIFVHRTKDGMKKIVIRDGWTSYHIQGELLVGFPTEVRGLWSSVKRRGKHSSLLSLIWPL
ncbi:unnamed protein product, partial [Ixodes pacificus]